MPAIRTNRYIDDFEDDLDTPTRVKCLACSAASETGDVTILRSGRKGHLASQKHLDAVLRNSSAQRTPALSDTLNTQVPNPAPEQHAKLTLADLFRDSDNEDDEGEQPGRAHSPLDDIMMDGNTFLDAEHNDIFFSAGQEQLEDRSALRQELRDGIRNLDYYDHTVFGKMGLSGGDGEDLTVSSAVAAMVEMGLDDDSDA
ncbi:hypothetical protein C8J57DRAFT_1509241 [Mycena rebaudengoi]|nr:hypothetical protein C8J57DRAFT_1509241 [Mycena rebaudengoi]